MSNKTKYRSEYCAWVNMRHRCTNDKHVQFKDYGGRGIKVCDRWISDFDQFLKDVGPKPTPELTLDRLDNDGHYEPGNVGWRSRSDQVRNRRKYSKSNDRLISHNGRVQTLEDWSKETGIKRTTLQSRLETGWSVSDALTLPVRSYS